MQYQSAKSANSSGDSRSKPKPQPAAKKSQVGLPGFAEKDIDVRVEPRRLLIAGDREEKSEQTLTDKSRIVYSEWNTNRILRTIDLPAEVDPDKVTAFISNGVLQVTMPKKETSRKVTIGPKAA